jgi:hypothetical protein
MFRHMPATLQRAGEHDDRDEQEADPRHDEEPPEGGVLAAQGVAEAGPGRPLGRTGIAEAAGAIARAAPAGPAHRM